jgi:CubicO group peptidase (beta-lactamase class C family)
VDGRWISGYARAMRSLVRPLLLASLLLGACAEAPSPAVAPPPSAAPPPSSAAPAPPPPPASPPYGSAEQLGGWIDAYVAAFGSHWGEAYAAQGYLEVAQDGHVIFEKAYGKADREHGKAAGPDTRFRIGSITKQFTATAILQLEKKGLLKVEDPVRKYLPDYPAPAGDKVTIHHLLTHTAGIPSYTDDEELMKARDKPKTRAEMLAVFKDKPLEFEPGQKHRYSNSGYFLLGVIIEKVSGKSYEEYLQDNVLRPAGMTRTSTVDAPDAPDTAVGYTVGPDEALAPSRPIDMSIPFSAGALRSTARDLLAWDRALLGEAVLDEASKKRMFTPFKDDYAYGWTVSEVASKTMVSHSGGIDGFSSFIARVPSEKLVVVALSNNEGFAADKMARPAVEMALTGKKIDPRPERAITAIGADLVKSLSGEYAITDESRKELDAKVPAKVVEAVLTLSVATLDDKLYFKPAGQPRLFLFRGEDGALFTKRSGIEIVAEPATAGAPVKALELRQASLKIHYVRTKADPTKKGKPAAKPKKPAH